MKKLTWRCILPIQIHGVPLKNVHPGTDILYSMSQVREDAESIELCS